MDTFYEYRILIDEQEYFGSEIDITSPITLENSVMNYNFEIGNANAAKLTFAIRPNDAQRMLLRTGATVSFFVRERGTTDWFNRGVYFISLSGIRHNTNGTTNIECYDTLANADVPFIVQPIYPETGQRLAELVCEQLGIKLHIDNNIVLMHFRFSEDTTMRQILYDIALFNGGNFVIDYNNQLKLVRLAYVGKLYEVNQSAVTYDDYHLIQPFDGFNIMNRHGEEMFSSNEYADNPFDVRIRTDLFNPEVARGVATLVNSQRYHPFIATGVRASNLVNLDFGDEVDIVNNKHIVHSYTAYHSSKIVVDVSSPVSLGVERGQSNMGWGSGGGSAVRARDLTHVWDRNEIDYIVQPLQEVQIAEIFIETETQQSASGGISVGFECEEDTVINWIVRCNGNELSKSPYRRQYKAGSNGFEPPKLALDLRDGDWTFTLSLVVEKGRVWIYKRQIEYFYLLIHSWVTPLSIAIQDLTLFHPIETQEPIEVQTVVMYQNELSVHTAIYIENHRYVARDFNIAYVVHDNVKAAAIEFDGDFFRLNNTRTNLRLVTDQQPVIAFVSNDLETLDNLYAQVGNDIGTRELLATEALQVSMVRGWGNRQSHEEQEDMGLICVYLGHNGTVRVRTRVDEHWQEEHILTHQSGTYRFTRTDIMPFGIVRGITNVQVTRLSDFRVSIALTFGGGYEENIMLLSYQNFLGTTLDTYTNNLNAEIGHVLVSNLTEEEVVEFVGILHNAIGNKIELTSNMQFDILGVRHYRNWSNIAQTNIPNNPIVDVEIVGNKLIFVFEHDIIYDDLIRLNDLEVRLSIGANSPILTKNRTNYSLFVNQNFSYEVIVPPVVLITRENNSLFVNTTNINIFNAPTFRSTRTVDVGSVNLNATVSTVITQETVYRVPASGDANTNNLNVRVNAVVFNQTTRIGDV